MKFQGHVLEVNRDCSGCVIVDLSSSQTFRFNFQAHNLGPLYGEREPMIGDRVQFECNFRISGRDGSVTGFILTSFIVLICRATPIPLANST